MRESEVVAHLKKWVSFLGGETRKAKWEGRRHAPDLLVLLPGKACLVETKALGKRPRPGQLREIERLRKSNLRVFVLDSAAAVEIWAREWARP